MLKHRQELSHKTFSKSEKNCKLYMLCDIYTYTFSSSNKSTGKGCVFTFDNETCVQPYCNKIKHFKTFLTVFHIDHRSCCG